MITIITGKPGAGKTLYMTYKALDMFIKGYDVYANWKLDFSAYVEKKKLDKDTLGKVYFWSEIPELLSIKGGQIFIDKLKDTLTLENGKTCPHQPNKSFLLIDTISKKTKTEIPFR